MIKDTLMHIHVDIAKKREDILNIKQKIEEKQELLKIWDLEQMTDIADAVNESGKPLFSNETKRQAELERRKREDGHYIELKEQLKELKFEHDKEVITFQFLLDKQENMRALTRIMEV